MDKSPEDRIREIKRQSDRTKKIDGILKNQVTIINILREIKKEL